MQNENKSLKGRLTEKQTSLTRVQELRGSQDRILHELNDEVQKSHGLEYLVRKKEQLIEVLRGELQQQKEMRMFAEDTARSLNAQCESVLVENKELIVKLEEAQRALKRLERENGTF